MAATNIYVTLVRPGKQPSTVEITSGASVEDALAKAGLGSGVYSGWSFTDEDGDALTLASRLENSTSVICGQRVDGAFVVVAPAAA